MTSLGLLMLNYSDSEDERSSDEEGRRKRARKRGREVMNDALQLNKELDQDEDPEDEQQTEIKFNKSQSTSLMNSPELTPSLGRMKLDKLNEHPAAKQQFDYQQDYYLVDDFEPLHSTGTDDEEMDSVENASPLIIDDDKDKPDNQEETGQQINSFVDKLDRSKYSPKSFHRLLIGTDEQEIQIPEPPKDKQCSVKLIEKISRLHSLIKQGRNMNDEIQKRKSFRNPSIYEKLILHCGIDEFGTNLPPEIFDPNQFRNKDTHNEERDS